MPIPNPNGANGHTSDPREQICWDNYVKSITEGGKGNAYQAAINARYEESSAIKITTRDWFVERLQNLKRKGIFQKAEKVLEECLEMPTEVRKTDNEEEYVVTDSGLIKIKQDTAKFIAERLGKEEGYSQKREIDHTTLGEKINQINYILPNGDINDKIEKNVTEE